MLKFSINDKVRWNSQAAGIWKEKRGVIIAIVAPKREAVPIADKFAFPFRYGGGVWRDHESYLVLVDNKVIYWPRVAALRLEIKS